MEENKVISNDVKDVKARLQASYGVNRVIEGEYDEKLSAKCHNGTFVGKMDGDVLVYRGVPFAQPPVDALRWKAPQPTEDDDRVFEAYYNGKSPIQTEWETEQASYYPQGEDCLYLNIWVNPACTDTDKTVMAFIHGGSYGWGGTADPMYDGANFVRNHPDIVLVTMGYRIGMMGFIDLSYLEGGEEYPDAPNLGLLDQIEALRWIQKNIAAFGGNRDNVTVFGESAGGGSVSLLPIIPMAKGLFRRVIAESGSVALTFSKEDSKYFTKRLIKAAGTDKMSDLLAMNETQLRAINEEINYFNIYPMRDGRIIPLDPYAPYMKGETADVDILIGTNSNEMNYWIGEVGGIVPYRLTIPVKYENDLRLLNREDKKRTELFMNSLKGHSIWRMSEFYNETMFRLPAIRQAEGHVKNGGKAYMYYWTEPSVIRFHGACHAVELAYVFGNREETLYTGQVADEELSRLVQEMWTNFARTGDPSAESHAWPVYDLEKRPTMVLNTDARLEEDVLSKQRKLLYPLLRYQIHPSYAELDFNVPFVRRAAAIGAAVIGAAALGIGLLLRKKK